MKSRILTIAILILPLLVLPVHAFEDFLPAKVKDISDRAYEPAMIKLLDEAREFIVISMYNISLGKGKRNPIRFLLRDLLEARQRGVEVTLYLNTRFGYGKNKKGTQRLVGGPMFEELERAGCKIHLMSPYKRLHDKLIIVDGRYVVEASANWSITALKGNLESATLIDSPELAKIKLLRLKMFLSEPRPKTKEPHKALYLGELPDNIRLSKNVLLDKRYLPQMLTRRDNRGMDLYLLLLAYSQNTGKKEFFIDLEAMGISLGMPGTWSDTSLRRQVILALRRLEKRYKLINVRFYYNKDAWIEFADISSDNFTIPSELIDSNPNKDMPIRVKFLLMVKNFLEAQGEDFGSMSGHAIGKRFNIHFTTINKALKELRELERDRT